jgi:hypothetical protein
MVAKKLANRLSDQFRNQSQELFWCFGAFSIIVCPTPGCRVMLAARQSTDSGTCHPAQRRPRCEKLVHRQVAQHLKDAMNENDGFDGPSIFAGNQPTRTRNKDASFYSPFLRLRS